MRLLFLSTASTDETFQRAVTTCRGAKPSPAGIRFDRNVAVGLSKLVDLTAVSFVPVPSWPNSSRVLWRFAPDEFQGATILHLPLINLPVVKQLGVLLGFLSWALRFALAPAGDEPRAILISSVGPEFVLPAKLIGCVFRVPVFGIVTDLPELVLLYRTDQPAWKTRMAHWANTWLRSLSSTLTGYIVLSEQMLSVVNPQRRPHLRMEGLIEDGLFGHGCGDSRRPAVMYAGALNRHHGVARLVAAFRNADLKGFELWLFGAGDLEPELEAISAIDPRIRLFGSVPDHREVLRHQQLASLLVNPRPCDDLVGKYSFPSKLIEFMASGTPVLTTRFPSLPAEYLPFLYCAAGDSEAALSDALRNVFAQPEDTRLRLGSRAREFILEQKTQPTQSRLLFQFISSNITKQAQTK